MIVTGKLNYSSGLKIATPKDRSHLAEQDSLAVFTQRSLPISVLQPNEIATASFTQLRSRVSRKLHRLHRQSADISSTTA